MTEPRVDTSSRISSLPLAPSQFARESNEAPVLPRIEGISSNSLFPLSGHHPPASSSLMTGEQQAKLIPRSATAQGSMLPFLSHSRSPGVAQDVLVESDNEDRRANSAGARPTRTNGLTGPSASQNHLSMLDFLTAEPRLIKPGISSGLPSSSSLNSAEGSRSSLSASVESPEVSGPGRRRGDPMPAGSSPKRKSLGMLGKAPIRGASRAALASESTRAHTDSENENELAYHLRNRGARSAGLAVSSGRGSPFERPKEDIHFLYRAGKGKARLEDDDVPLLQLKVIPVTDLIIMFGSTQTSSNYSLSGKVVLRLNTNKNNGGQGSRSQRAKSSKILNGSYDSTPEEKAWQSYPMSASDSNNSFKTALGSDDERDDGVAEECEINVRSLQIIFSGFALYGDRTGRLATTRLAHSQYDLLPSGGTNITCTPESASGQDYEIEFNLSVPGWLPSSLTSRFGGTFYCLEAKAEYQMTSKSEAAPQSRWLVPPPRRGSRTESPSPLSSSFEDSRSYESDTLDEISSQDKGRTQADDIVDSRPLPAQARASWLSKTARQLQIKVVKPSSSPIPASQSSAMITPTQASSTEGKFSGHGPSSALVASKYKDGVVQVKSKAKTIVIGRCREVVPVPLARMAVIGPEGLPEGAFQDPPPLPRSSSVDRNSRSRSSTITPATLHRHPSPPPPVPSVFNAPSDPAKLATLGSSSSISQPCTPRRGSSTLPSHDGPGHSTPHSPSHRSSRRSDNFRRASSAVPMRHFMHRPMLHPPASAQVAGAEAGLPFSLTLTLPSYVTVDGPESDVLSFSLQIEVGRSTAWSKVRELGGLRLRDMQLQCIQTERHSSVASRTFCSSYPLPLESKVEPYEIPIIETWRGHDTRRFPFQQEASKLRAAYDRSLVDEHLELLRLGRAPPAAEQNVERVRTSVVGPPPGHRSRKGSNEGGFGAASSSKGKSNADRERRDDSVEPERNPQRSAQNAARKDRRKSMPASASAPSGLGLSAARRALAAAPPNPADSSSSEREDSATDFTSTPGEAARRAGRGRRAYQSAIRGLSNLATAVLDISLDMEGSTGQTTAVQGDEGGRSRAKGSDRDASQPAFHYFSGSDGHGVDLTKGRVRMAINLPLVSSDGAKAKSIGASRLVADFESPYIRVRHKLKVKLGFGFGSKPLGGEEDGSWGQALVMCVPVRFTDAAPREVREQFAPLPVAQFATAAAGDRLSSSMPVPQSTREHEAPLLPSYNQLFREDGSRLADEGEDLPQYPGPASTKARSLASVPQGGSVTAPVVPRIASLVDAQIDSDAEPVAGLEEAAAAAALFHNRIVPSRVVDESVPLDQASDIASRQQQVEFEEMELEEAQEARQTADRLNETVNMDDEDDLYEDFGDEDALGVFSSSDQARSGAEEDSQVEEND